MLIADNELIELESALKIADDRRQDFLIALIERTINNTRFPGLVQPSDTNEWWHISWERLSDVAFICFLANKSNNFHQVIKACGLTPETEIVRLREWLKSVVLDTIRKSPDEWVGPSYRRRKRIKRLLAHLETAHAGIAVATVFDLCPDIFTATELDEIREALINKPQKLCQEWLNNTIKRQRIANNWFMVLLNGYGTISAIIGDRVGVEKSVENYELATKLYNQDSYGESLQYWNYATFNLAHLFEVLVRYNPSLEHELDISCYTRSIPWVVSSFLEMKQVAGWGDLAYPHSLNWGDSAAVFRPTADLLLHISRRAKKSMPIEAGLASWIFHETYQDPKLGPDDRATFGFFNNFLFPTILNWKYAENSITPEQANLPLVKRFENGNVIVRDSWHNPSIVLSVQAGYEPLRSDGHRHEDQNSFILSYGGENFFVDPGHCCYRLDIQAQSKSAASHNTWSFITKTGSRLKQNLVQGSIYKDIPALNKFKLLYQEGNMTVIESDAADVYGKPIQKAQRMWIVCGTNSIFLVDTIKSNQPVAVETSFLLNNREGKLQTQAISPRHLIFRRNNVAIKFVLVTAISRNYFWNQDDSLFLDENNPDTGATFSQRCGYVHEFYHPLPNQKGQGAEGSGIISTWTTPIASEHLLIYAIAMDSIQHIWDWKIETLNNNTIMLYAPSKKGSFQLEMKQDGSLIVEESIYKTRITIPD
ncbi:Heparinase II/III-like C-terminal domain-containing protein [Nostoc sp. DSM 114161]|jgi:hypothetical protein|uniref:heparinase II/III domain-containing protein n=1 Tax=Nostoc sp. DSM 114161 TaxID=3440143 RepID=UPI004045724B